LIKAFPASTLVLDGIHVSHRILEEGHQIIDAAAQLWGRCPARPLIILRVLVDKGCPHAPFLHCCICGKLICKMRNGTGLGTIILFAAGIVIHAKNIRTMRGALC